MLQELFKRSYIFEQASFHIQDDARVRACFFAPASTAVPEESFPPLRSDLQTRANRTDSIWRACGGLWGIFPLFSAGKFVQRAFLSSAREMQMKNVSLSILYPLHPTDKLCCHRV